jgi:hypothetical protein
MKNTLYIILLFGYLNSTAQLKCFDSYTFIQNQLLKNIDFENGHFEPTKDSILNNITKYEALNLKDRPELTSMTVNKDRYTLSPETIRKMNNLQVVWTIVPGTQKAPKYLNELKRLKMLTLVDDDDWGIPSDQELDKWEGYSNLMSVNKIKADSLQIYSASGFKLHKCIYKFNNLTTLSFKFKGKNHKIHKRFKDLRKLKFIRFHFSKHNNKFRVPKVVRKKFSNIFIEFSFDNGKVDKNYYPVNCISLLNDFKKVILSIDTVQWYDDKFVGEIQKLKKVEWLEIYNNGYMRSKQSYQKRLNALSKLNHLKVLIIGDADELLKKDLSKLLPNTKIFCLGRFEKFISHYLKDDDGKLIPKYLEKRYDIFNSGYNTVKYDDYPCYLLN